MQCIVVNHHQHVLGEIETGEFQKWAQGLPTTIHVCLRFDQGDVFTANGAVSSDGPPYFPKPREVPLPCKEITENEPCVVPGCGICGSWVPQGDNGTRALLEEILRDEEQHVDWLEAQLHMIKEMGAENYLAQQLEE